MARPAKSRLLYDSQPRAFSADLATALGLSSAIVLQQLHFWLEIKARKEPKLKQIWVYNTYAEWQVEFPWWGERQVRRIIADLEERGLVVSRPHSPHSRTKEYRIDYPAMNVWISKNG